MGFLRALFAVIAATVLAFLLGMAFDYFRLAMDLQVEGLLMVFPAVAAVAGFIAAICALILTRGGQAARTAQPGSTGPAGRGRRGQPAEIIPGMPVYDDSRIRQPAAGRDSGKTEEQ